MRLQASGRVLAAWVGVLSGTGILAEGTVLGLRTFALADAAELDVIVPLGAVTDRTARGAGTDLPLPPTRAVAAWSAVTPPRGPWEPAGELPGDLLAAVARAGLAEVSDAVRERGAAAGLVRDRVWARDVREAAGPHPDLLDPEGGVPDGGERAQRRRVRGLRAGLPRARPARAGAALEPVDAAHRARRSRPDPLSPGPMPQRFPKGASQVRS